MGRFEVSGSSWMRKAFGSHQKWSLNLLTPIAQFQIRGKEAPDMEVLGQLREVFPYQGRGNQPRAAGNEEHLDLVLSRKSLKNCFNKFDHLPKSTRRYSRVIGVRVVLRRGGERLPHPFCDVEPDRGKEDADAGPSVFK